MKKWVWKLLIAATMVQGAAAVMYVSPSSRGLRLCALTALEFAVIIICMAVSREIERVRAMREAMADEDAECAYRICILDANTGAVKDETEADGAITIALTDTLYGTQARFSASDNVPEEVVCAVRRALREVPEC